MEWSCVVSEKQKVNRFSFPFSSAQKAFEARKSTRCGFYRLFAARLVPPARLVEVLRLVCSTFRATFTCGAGGDC